MSKYLPVYESDRFEVMKVTAWIMKVNAFIMKVTAILMKVTANNGALFIFNRYL